MTKRGDVLKQMFGNRPDFSTTIKLMHLNQIRIDEKYGVKPKGFWEWMIEEVDNDNK